jgi:ubiquinone/menaquinone biosynthesis C-methylase UbiE
MGLGRRKVGLDDAGAWVFNRMVDAYDARPAYPAALVDALADLAGPAVKRIGDLGAGIGHLALPLASRGHDVVAVEPALAMLNRLRDDAATRGLVVRAVHAAAESLPLPPASLDVVIIADALHFLDAELAATEIARVLVPRGALALVTCQPGDTPFMRDVVRVIEESVPRRPSALASPITHLAALTQVPLGDEVRFHDETPVDHATLDRILRSISFIGPAMNPARFATFQQRVHALSSAPVWARTFTVRVGHREPLSKRARLRAARDKRRLLSPPPGPPEVDS